MVEKDGLKLTANSYHVDNTTVQFSFFLNSALNFVERQFRKHFLYAEGFMFKLLQRENVTLGIKEITDLLAHLHTPIIYAYILFLGIVISILAIPLIYCTASCLKKRIDVLKYQCCFPIEIMILVLFVICWIVGSVGAYQITIQIQNALMIFPDIWRNAIHDLVTNADVFRMEIRGLVYTIENSTTLIANHTVLIPDCLADLYRTKLNINLEEAALRINGNTLVAEIVFSRSRFVLINNTIKHAVEVSANDLNKKIEDIYGILYDLQGNIRKNYSNLYSPKTYGLDQYKLLFKKFHFLEWKPIYNDLQIIFKQLLPAANKSLFFLDDLRFKLRNYSSAELNRITSATRTLQEICLGIEKNITQAINELLPLKMQDDIANKTYKIDNILSSLSLSRNYRKIRFSNGSLWIMLIPTIYAFIGWIILIIAFYTATDDIKNIFMNVAWTPSAKLTSYAFTIFRISMKYSVTGLWCLAILTTIFYCIYLPSSVFCASVNDQNFFKNYVDDPQVWNNKTWLGYKLQNYLPKQGHLQKMRDVLNNCYHNKSLYQSLNMQEYWNVGQHIDASNMTINVDVFQTIVAKAVQEVELPGEAMQQLIKNLEVTQQHLDFYFVQPIKNHVEQFQIYVDATLSKTINDMILDEIYIGPRMVLHELLSDVKLQTSNTLKELSELERFNNYLKDLQNELISINNLAANFSMIVHETTSSTVPTFLNNTSNDINSMKMEMKTTILTNIKNIGNCYVLPYVYDKLTWSVCGHGLLLITGAWITLGLISTSMFFCLILSCRTCGYIRGSQNNYYIWMQHVRSQRYSSDTVKLAGTLMFDQAGNLIGRSIPVKQPTEDKAV